MNAKPLSKPQKGFVIKSKPERDSPFIHTKKHLKSSLIYLIKTPAASIEVDKMRHLFFDTNLTTLPGPHAYVDDPDLFRSKSIEWLNDILSKIESLEEQFNRASKDDQRITQDNQSICFDPIISYSKLTTDLILDRFGGSLEAAGRHISDFTFNEVIPTMFNRPMTDFYYIGASQMDNGSQLLHNHPYIFRIATNHTLIDMNPEKLVENINRTRVQLTLKNPELFELLPNDIKRAQRMLTQGLLNDIVTPEIVQFLDSQADQLNQKFSNDEQTLTAKKAIFTEALQAQSCEELNTIFNENRLSKSKLAAAFKAQNIVLNYKRKGRKVTHIFLTNRHIKNFPIENISDKDLKKTLYKMVDFKIINELYNDPDISASSRLAEVEEIVMNSAGNDAEWLKAQLALIGFEMVANISKAGKILGVNFVDTRHGGIEIKASLSDQFDLQYLKDQFNLDAQSQQLIDDASVYKAREKAQARVSDAGQKRTEYSGDERVRKGKIFKPFRISAYPSELDFMESIKTSNSFCSLAKTDIQGDFAYSSVGKALFGINRDTKEVTILKDGKYTSTAAIRASIQYLIATGSTKIEITSGSDEDRKQIYILAKLQGLEVIGHTPDEVTKAAIQQAIALKTIKLEDSFIKSLDKHLIERETAIAAATKPPKLWVQSFQEYQIEIDPTAIRVNTLHALAKGLPIGDLINYREDRAIREVEQLKSLALKLYPEHPALMNQIAIWEAKTKREKPVSKVSPTLPVSTPATAPNFTMDGAGQRRVIRPDDK